MTTSVEIISPELWGHLLGEFGRKPDLITQRINGEMHEVLSAGLGVFANFREGLEPQGFRAVRKYLSVTDPDHPSQNAVILVVENLLHPSTDYPAHNERERYDMAGDITAGERTFHPKVAAQLRMRLWRRDPAHLGPDWHGDVRMRYWGEATSVSRTNEEGWGKVFISVIFSIDRTNPSQTAQHIKHILESAKPQILRGYAHPL